MQASDVMTTGVLSVCPTTRIDEIARLLSEHHVSAVPVMDEHQHLLGIVSEGDLIRRQELGTERMHSWWLSLLFDKEQQARDYSKSHAKSAQDLMTTAVITVEEETSLQQIADLLERHHIKRVPVLRDERVVGIVSRANLVQALAVRETDTLKFDSAVDDRTLRDTVIKKLHDDLGPGTTSINVTVDDGVVHLWGIVDGVEERKAIRVASGNIPGVRNLDCHLALSSDLPLAGI